MPNAKIEVKIGAITFSGEGEENWLSKQLDKIIQGAPQLLAVAPEPAGGSDVSGGDLHKKAPVGTLAKFLADKNATGNQKKRFLATAIWLHMKGEKRLKTRDVTKALQDNSQKRLGNPADCFSKNVSDGYCEKVGKEFFVTDEGKASLK